MGRYFTIQELTKSDTATSRGIDNTPTSEAIINLENLINDLLDPIREAFGGPIYVNSGYRSPQLNSAVGGSKSSQHMTGEAVDLDTRSISGNRRLMQLIQQSGLPFDQLIDEKNLSWIHVSYTKTRPNRNQILYL